MGAVRARNLNGNLADKSSLSKRIQTIFPFSLLFPLSYTDAAVREANYALDSLGAVGVGVLSSHAGKYLGNVAFKPLFENLNNRKSSREIVYIHLTEPVVNVNGALVFAPHKSGIQRRKEAMEAFWWDSAGPTYPNQVKGLLGCNVPKSQLKFGSVRGLLLVECGDGRSYFHVWRLTQSRRTIRTAGRAGTVQAGG
ncbi:hypothetical protein IWX48DRAFT_390557 [Phyllosticta citricarpa]